MLVTSVMQRHEVWQYGERTHVWHVAHRHRPNSQQQLHKVTNAQSHIGQHALPLKQCKTGIIMSMMVFWCRLKGREQTDAQRPLVTHSYRQDVWFVLCPQLMTMWVASKTGRRLTQASCAVNRGVWIIKFNPLSPQSLTKDPQTLPIAICNLDSAVVQIEKLTNCNLRKHALIQT